jgi:hypothetical protein
VRGLHGTRWVSEGLRRRALRSLSRALQGGKTARWALSCDAYWKCAQPCAVDPVTDSDSKRRDKRKREEQRQADGGGGGDASLEGEVRAHIAVAHVAVIVLRPLCYDRSVR